MSTVTRDYAALSTQVGVTASPSTIPRVNKISILTDNSNNLKVSIAVAHAILANPGLPAYFQIKYLAFITRASADSAETIRCGNRAELLLEEARTKMKTLGAPNEKRDEALTELRILLDCVHKILDQRRDADRKRSLRPMQS